MNLSNIFIRALYGGYRVPHAEIRDTFDLQGNFYRFTPHLANLFIYDALGIAYKFHRDELEGTNGYWRSEGSIADQWSIALSSAKKFPAIPKREGTMYSPDFSCSSVYNHGSAGPQAMYTYYQGEFGGPKLAIMIVDGTHIHRSAANYKVDEPVRFALFAKQDWKNDSVNGDLIVTHILMEGRYLPLDRVNINKALAYGKALFEQIKAGKEYDPAKALALFDAVSTPSAEV